MDGLTKSRVNRAGKAIREYMRTPVPPPSSDLHPHLDVLWHFRSAHSYPLGKATMGLRSVVATEGYGREISQRLKRLPTIMMKLHREPTLQLASMQDIGGCRAMLPSIEAVRKVERRLSNNRPPLRVSDYIAQPRSSGYRGVHVVVQYTDEDHVLRSIEVQLRTHVMHEWAITVEKAGARLDTDLKSSVGPEPLLDLLRVISEAMAIEESGEVVPSSLLDEMANRRVLAAPWLRHGGG
jgi:putative GTP pyrophosphokinase